MGERFRTRALVVTRAFAARYGGGANAPRTDVRRVLVAHNLLLGDTIMLTPLLAKLRALHPQAEIVLLAAPGVVPLYARSPYGVRALPFKPSDSSTTRALLDEAPFDLAIVPGDNRYSWVAAAMGARHVVAHAGDRPWTKQWFVDEQRAYASGPVAWGDMVADLVDGAPPPPFARGQWPAPDAHPFDAPQGDYAVLHVGASTVLKQWPALRWKQLAEELAQRGIVPVWSAGRGEEPIVAACDPAGRHRSFAGQLDLAQLWQLLAGARILIAPDTGVAHLGRAAWVPTLSLFGPGSPTLAGNGLFWRDAPWRALAVDPFPCRDQRLLFGREIAWVRRCARTPEQCAEPRCVQGISVAEVMDAAATLLAEAK